MSNLPYKPARKPGQYSHGFSQSAAPFWGFLGGLAVLAAFGLWPAIFFHGEREDAWTGQEHWAWNAHSTIACCTWWGILVLAGVIGALARTGSPVTSAAPEFPDLRRLYGNPFLDPPAGIRPPWLQPPGVPVRVKQPRVEG